MTRFYDILMAPLETCLLRKQRLKLIPLAKGNVLEIGSGTGVNLRLYDWDRVKSLTLTDLSVGNRLRRQKAIHSESQRINILEADAGQLPFPENSFDTVVFTLLFCSVENVPKALSEVMRVLQPKGQVIFIEHVLPEARPWKDVFNFLTPLWKHLAGGCCLNRKTVNDFRMNGFILTEKKSFGLAFTSGLLSKKEE